MICGLPGSVRQVPISLMKSLLTLFLAGAAFLTARADKQILLIAGVASHGPGEHEFRAGSLLLSDCLNKVPGIHATVASNGWPSDESLLRSADAILLYADGGGGHPAILPDRMKLLDELAKKGVGIGTAHYGVEVPAGAPGFAMLRWTGGYFEMYWSVNPTWHATFSQLPTHPITRGVQPFAMDDEWYYHMRFAPGMSGITPILSVVPPVETVRQSDGTHSSNPWVRWEVEHGIPQPLMWAFERPTGGRGFGFTGGHYHKNWADNNFRRLVLNALVWAAGAEVPAGGIESTVTPEQLKANQDPK